jgi:hypothetical protein
LTVLGDTFKKAAACGIVHKAGLGIQFEFCVSLTDPISPRPSVAVNRHFVSFGCLSPGHANANHTAIQPPGYETEYVSRAPRPRFEFPGPVPAAAVPAEKIKLDVLSFAIFARFLYRHMLGQDVLAEVRSGGFHCFAPGLGREPHHRGFSFCGFADFFERFVIWPILSCPPQLGFLAATAGLFDAGPIPVRAVAPRTTHWLLTSTRRPTMAATQAAQLRQLDLRHDFPLKKQKGRLFRMKTAFATQFSGSNIRESPLVRAWAVPDLFGREVVVYHHEDTVTTHWISCQSLYYI